MQVAVCDAKEALPRAYRIFESIGAKAAMIKVREVATQYELLSCLPRQRRGPYKLTRQHPVGLTSKEQQVLQYLIRGSSNQEIANL